MWRCLVLHFSVYGVLARPSCAGLEEEGHNVLLSSSSQRQLLLHEKSRLVTFVDPILVFPPFRYVALTHTYELYVLAQGR